MASFLMRTVVTCTFTLSCVPIQSLDYVKERYHRFMLGNQLYQVLQDKVEEKKCDLLKTNAAVRVVLAENAYQMPFWVSMLNNVSPHESLFSYAFHLYTVMQNVLDVVESRLKTQFSTIAIASLDMRRNMDFVLISRDETVAATQIADNVKAVKNILNDYKAAVKKSKATPDDITRMENAIDAGLERIAKAEPRLTRIERWHRTMKREQFERYIAQYCK